MPTLEALLARRDIELAAVYTQPDRPAGRGQRLQPSPIKQVAERAGLSVIQPENLKNPEDVKTFSDIGARLLIVVAYGLMLPAPFITAPVTAINVHASLLPRWRGAAPIQRALMAGDNVSGISIMRVVQRLDAGPVWLRQSYTIGEDETYGSLHHTLASLGAETLDAALDAMGTNEIDEAVQDENLVTYAHKITSADRTIHWANSAITIARQIRALAPAPGALAQLKQLTVKLLAARADQIPTPEQPGTFLGCDQRGLAIATGSGVLRVTELQPAGKQKMLAAAFMNGYGAQL